jgi:hypothetical protein
MPPKVSQPTLQSQAEAVGSRVRAAFAELIRVLPGGARRAKDVQEALGLDNALGWKLYRTATATEDLESLHFVPTPAPLEKALAAAAARSVPEKALRAVREASAEFEKLVRTHAATRREFESLLIGIEEGPTESALLRDRRTAFRVNSTLWGLQADVRAQLAIFVPNASPGAVPSASIVGWVGLHQTRRDVPLCVEADIGAVEKSGTGIVLRDGVLSLLGEFSSIAGDDLKVEQTADGHVHTVLKLDDVGPAAGASIFLRRTSSMRPKDDFGSATLMATPSRLLHSDLLVATGISDPLTARVETFARPSNVGSTRFETRPQDRIPSSDRVVHIPGVAEMPDVPEIPRYAELVQRVLEDMGCAGTTFDLYRCRVPYPMLHATVYVLVDERKGAARRPKKA